MSAKTRISLLLFVSIGLLFSCKKKQNDFVNSANASKYIYAYTSGLLSKTSAISISFTENMVEEAAIGSEDAMKLLSISPSAKGTAIWENRNTLVWTPEKQLNSGEEYVGTVRLGKAIKGADNFNFSFKIKEQYFDVVIDAIQPASNNDLTQQIAYGKVYTADVANDKDIEKLLKVKQRGADIAVEWKHDGANNNHAFTIKGIVRKESATTVNVSWNGNAIDVDKKGEQELNIPAIGDFEVMDVNVIQQGDPHIAIQFSDPLLSTQNYNGLIKISNYNGKLKFVSNGAILKVYPSSMVAGERQLEILEGVKNLASNKIGKQTSWDIRFESMKPEIRLLGKGTIMPSSDGLIFPFEAVSLNAVNVEIFKIHSNNILQFLQVNNLEGDYQLERVGNIVFQGKVDLKSLNPNSSTTVWQHYALDLSKLIQTDKHAVYQVRIAFQKEYSNYFCSDEAAFADKTFNWGKDDNGNYRSIMGNYNGIYGYYRNYYDDREDACKPAYYNKRRFVERNVLASNLGIIAKKGQNDDMFVAVTDLRTTSAMSGADIELYDYQQQLISTIKTSSDGTAFFKANDRAHFLVVKSGSERGYLKIKDGNALSVSRFDVGGERVQKGLKGYIYAERGVWRPGDSVYVNFVLNDEEATLPKDHPVSFELYDARGQLYDKTIRTYAVNKVYDYYFKTTKEAPTGDWRLVVKAGGASFTEYLKIETIKPNRLKILFDFDKKELSAEDSPIRAPFSSKWLHGAPARNLNAKVEATIRAVNTTFKTHNDFEFDDPARDLSTEPIVLFDGPLDNEGRANVAIESNGLKNAPGKVRISFKSRVFEKSGDFSTDNYSVGLSPFESYVGIGLPTNKWGEKRIDLDKEGKIAFVVLDENGEPVKNRTINIGLYRVNWRWWWENSYENISSYASSNHYNAIKSETITTNRRGEATWKVKVDDWGRYMIRAVDKISGHASGDFFYAGYPWYDDEGGQDKTAAAMLNFKTDKSTYKVGELIEISIPSNEIARGLITIENGSKVLTSRWFDAKEGENTFKIEATEEWTPNVYAHVSLLQPHKQSKNDLPMRMYGVIPIKVEDPNTKLEPVLKMVDELAPEQTFTVEVKEKNKENMAYTIAIVDEGLLDLTRFKTPNPWDEFFAKEALGVQSWDMYDNVLGAYGAQIERILSIGGDMELGPKGAEEVNRFKPVVMHLGPFYLKGGKKAKHTLKMPNYVGSVRAMVVASGENAYGAGEKTVPVKKPLMVLATVPRVLGSGESFSLPVNVFAMDDKVKNVNVQLTAKGNVSLVGGNTQQITFNSVGDEMVFFDVKVKELIGKATFVVKATGAGETATQEIEVEIRNPNPYETRNVFATLKSGQTWEQDVAFFGMLGTNECVLEMSSIPPINLGKRLKYLIRYPHGCIEQTTSSGFPQLFLDDLTEVPTDKKQQIKTNIQSAIDRIKQFQTAAGGFGYWPGDEYASAWGSNYAGHFLLEAKAKGYHVPQSLLDNWKNYQKTMSGRWNPAYDGYSSYNSSELTQSYRLYTLALAGAPDLSAMNRLRERGELSGIAKWRLAAAYALAGKESVAKQMINGLNYNIKPYRHLSYTYGSDTRDIAMILETLTILEKEEAIGKLLKRLSESLNSNKWMSTQTTAYALLAIGKYASENTISNQLKFDYTVDGGATKTQGSTKSVTQIDIPENGNATRKLMVNNTTAGVLFLTISTTGQPVAGKDSNIEDDLKLQVNYLNMEGKALNVESLEQGTDFVAKVTITNPGSRGINYEELALTQIFPSGWEIHNTRLSDVDYFKNSTSPDYQDIRDDRVYTYFDLRRDKSHTFYIQLNAAYPGDYYLPATNCSAMYDNTITAQQSGRWVKVRSVDEI